MIDFTIYTGLESYVDDHTSQGNNVSANKMIILQSNEACASSADKQDQDQSSSLETFGPWSDEDDVEESKAPARLPGASDQTFLDFDELSS